jgi:hypothetical protein
MSTLMAYSQRAPIRQDIIAPQGEEDKRPRTRCGYLVPEAYSCYEQALGEVGAAASGKALHFAADLICSGGLDIWIRGVYSYSVQHINLGNPRIFSYLRTRVAELDKKAEQLPQDNFFTHPDVQSNISEVVLILQLCPKHAKVSWPKVDENTKRDGWIRGVAGAAEHRATRKIWSNEGDSPTLYLVGNEMCKAVQEGSTERTLFWIRWTIDEDARIRKETKGAGLTNRERGPAGSNKKQSTDSGHYLCAVLVELYREMAEKGVLKMNEEFQELVRLWRGGEHRMAARLRRDCLGLMAMILCEVPRWKTPSSPPLVPDPMRLSRAVTQSTSFFNEVLAHRPLPLTHQLKPNMTKAKGERKKKNLTEKEQQSLSIEDKLGAYDAIMEAYLNGR